MIERRLAALLWSICVALALVTAVLLWLGAGVRTRADSFGLGGLGGLSFLLASLAFATMGTLIAIRVRGNPIGPVFIVIGLTVGAGDLAFQYADRAVFVAPEMPGATFVAWAQNLGLPPAFGLLAVALLLFPDGRLASRRWRPALWLAVAGIVLNMTGYALRPGRLDEPFDGIANPLGVPGAFAVMDVASALGWMAMGASVGLAAVAVTVRLRRSRGLARQQLKWIALAAVVAGVAVVSAFLSFFAGLEGVAHVRMALLGVGCAAFPLAAGVAILRHRLYDIDVVINRALVYGALTAVLAGAYVGLVLVLQLALSPLTEDSGLAVAGSTLAVAALFGPARARIQEAVDRRFYRRRYDARRTLEVFVGRLRHELDLDALGGELRAVVDETLQPAHVSLWLRPEAHGR